MAAAGGNDPLARWCIRVIEDNPPIKWMYFLPGLEGYTPQDATIMPLPRQQQWQRQRQGGGNSDGGSHDGDGNGDGDLTKINYLFVVVVVSSSNKKITWVPYTINLIISKNYWRKFHIIYIVEFT